MWREDVVERHRENGRRLNLTVGHRSIRQELIIPSLQRDVNFYDIVFAMSFLEKKVIGRVESLPSTDLISKNVHRFPVNEYPAPIRIFGTVRSFFVHCQASWC